MIGLVLAAHLYTVQPGDYLSKLVGNNWPGVCETNHLSNCNLIYPGEKLDLTVGNTRLTASVAASEPRTDTFGGTLGCSGLEALWTAAGGSPGSAFIAAEIAMAESGGYQYATGPVGEEGYWQINPVNGDATYDPIGNAKAAIYLSGDGTNWSPWTTYTHGLYYGRCLNG